MKIRAKTFEIAQRDRNGKVRFKNALDCDSKQSGILKTSAIFMRSSTFKIHIHFPKIFETFLLNKLIYKRKNTLNILG